jgi:hypothetical protein
MGESVELGGPVGSTVLLLLFLVAGELRREHLLNHGVQQGDPASVRITERTHVDLGGAATQFPIKATRQVGLPIASARRGHQMDAASPAGWQFHRGKGPDELLKSLIIQPLHRRLCPAGGSHNLV